jgi:hypothetical protein
MTAPGTDDEWGEWIPHRPGAHPRSMPGGRASCDHPVGSTPNAGHGGAGQVWFTGRVASTTGPSTESRGLAWR